MFEKQADSVPQPSDILQISDAYKPSKPLDPVVEDGLQPRGRWSHDYRPLPYDGGFLPIVPMVDAVLKTGFRGWFSIEVFDSGKDGKGKKTTDLNAFALKAMESYKRLVKEASQSSVTARKPEWQTMLSVCLGSQNLPTLYIMALKTV